MSLFKMKRGQESKVNSLAKEDGSLIFSLNGANDSTLRLDQSVSGTVQRLGVAVDKAKDADHLTLGTGTADVARNVWFSDSNVRNMAVYNDNFKYNPVKNSLTTNITGSAASAGTANYTKGGESESNYQLNSTQLHQTIDLSSSTYDQNTWYPVVGSSIPYRGYSRIICYVQLNSGTKPAWSTHNSGFTCNLDVLVKAAGWGTTNAGTIVLDYSWSFCSGIPISYSQMTNASRPVIWMRGGGKYFIRSSEKFDWSIKTSAYTNSQQTVQPQTSCPAISLVRSTIYANLDGTASNSNALGGSSLSQVLASAGGGNAFTGLDTATNNIVKLTRANGGTVQKTINNVSNASSASYATSAENATNATNASKIIDYGNANKTISIGYAGAGLTTTNLTHIAGYTESGTKIKDVSKDVLKSWLGSMSQTTDSVNYVRVYNSSNVGNSSSVTVNDLSKKHFAQGMIYSATDNPLGKAGWVHVQNMAWTDNSDQWVSQIAFNVQNGTGAYYRSSSGGGHLAGRAWNKFLDSSNYTDYAADRTALVSALASSSKVTFTRANAGTFAININYVENASTANNANKLGGLPSSEYALKSQLSGDINALSAKRLQAYQSKSVANSFFYRYGAPGVSGADNVSWEGFPSAVLSALNSTANGFGNALYRKNAGVLHLAAGSSAHDLVFQAGGTNVGIAYVATGRNPAYILDTLNYKDKAYTFNKLTASSTFTATGGVVIDGGSY